MNRAILGVLVVVCTVTAWQAVGLSQAQSGPPPQVAFDIPKTDIDTLLKNSPPAVDQQLRVVDMGKYNLAVGVIHRADQCAARHPDRRAVSRLDGRNLHRAVRVWNPDDGGHDRQ